jgi:hypothetical protein
MAGGLGEVELIADASMEDEIMLDVVVELVSGVDVDIDVSLEEVTTLVAKELNLKELDSTELVEEADINMAAGLARELTTVVDETRSHELESELKTEP